MQKALEEEKAAQAELAMQAQSYANLSLVSSAAHSYRMCACACGCISGLSCSEAMNLNSRSLRRDMSLQLAISSCVAQTRSCVTSGFTQAAFRAVALFVITAVLVVHV